GVTDLWEYIPEAVARAGGGVEVASAGAALVVAVARDGGAVVNDLASALRVASDRLDGVGVDAALGGFPGDEVDERSLGCGSGRDGHEVADHADAHRAFVEGVGVTRLN